MFVQTTINKFVSYQRRAHKLRPALLTLAVIGCLLAGDNYLWLNKRATALAQTRSPQQPKEFTTLEIETRDKDTGQVIPARFYITDKGGERWSPPGAYTYDKGEEHHFISPGTFRIQLPPGDYNVLAERGTEYLPASATITLAAGQVRRETLSLKRWIDMNKIGWYSGDLHNHRNVVEMPTLLLAEDLNLAPTITDWIWEDHQVAHPLKSVMPIQQIDATHAFSVLDKEVERLESGPGAVALLGLKTEIPFSGTRLYPNDDSFCVAAHAQGGYVDAEKIMWRDAAALIALGQIDFVGIVHNHFNRHSVELETDKWGMIPKDRPEYNTVSGMPLWGMDIYYRFLNCGFKLPVSAGSASGVKAAPLGYNRVYVRMDEPFTYARWFENLKAGRSFATNGPVLFLTVNGKEPGDTLQQTSKGGEKLRIRAEAISRATLDRLEIIYNGKVIKSVNNKQGANKLAIEFEQNFSQAGWFAARSFEHPTGTIRFAHTSPIYYQTGAPKFMNARVDARFFLNWIDREISYYEKQTGFRNSEERSEVLSFFRKARSVYSRLSGETP